MARKDHTLDDKIISAAREEFLTYGYKDASLHKIAEKAQVTTGALYTRYEGKDHLFASLLTDVFQSFVQYAQPANEKYMATMQNPSLESFLEAMEYESKIYLDILFKHQDECVLLFCKSEGSSVGIRINEAIEHKTAVTVDFFSKISHKTVDPYLVKTLMNVQFDAYRNLLSSPMDRDETTACMNLIFRFFEAGWKDFYTEYLE